MYSKKIRREEKNEENNKKNNFIAYGICNYTI